MLRFWARKNWPSIFCYSVYVITYLTLSWAATPHVYDQFPDSPTYLTVSFLGHAERLWTIPVLYFFGGSSAGRVALQTLISVGSWVALSVQFARVLRTRFIRRISQAFVLLVSLCPPIIQWNRIILSESIAISLTVLLLAASLALARRMDLRALAAFLVVAVLWTFTRQVQAFIVVTLVIPFVLLAWRRPQARQLALVGGAGIAVIGVWGTLTALQTSSVSPAGIAATNPSEVQLAGIIQYRASTDPGELSYLHSHGLPRTSALKIPPPFSRVGQPVNVSQFADPFAEYRLADDPKFKQWANRSGEHVYLKYLITHPTTMVFQPIVNARTTVGDESRLHLHSGPALVGIDGRVRQPKLACCTECPLGRAKIIGSLLRRRLVWRRELSLLCNCPSASTNAGDLGGGCCVAFRSRMGNRDLELRRYRTPTRVHRNCCPLSCLSNSSHRRHSRFVNFRCIPDWGAPRFPKGDGWSASSSNPSHGKPGRTCNEFGSALERRHVETARHGSPGAGTCTCNSRRIEEPGEWRQMQCLGDMNLSRPSEPMRLCRT